ncbi:cytochrome P450 [Mycena vulgaris]|nr:cytochrome P450 [Mycena vulgaris]
MSSQLRLSIVATFASYILFKLAKVLYEELSSPLRDLPGPTGAHFILGHFKQINSDAGLTRKWRAEFGTNFQYRALLNKRALYTADTKALNHILLNDSLYQKGPIERTTLKHFLGDASLLVVETDEHKRQRRILNPAFGLAQIRELTGIFNQKSTQLRDIWTHHVEPESGVARLDVLAWLRKMTLDAIGQAGFNYRFDAMEPKDEPNKLVRVLDQLFHSGQSQAQAAFRLAQVSIPILRIFPTPVGKIMQKARRAMDRIGNQLLSDSKADLKTAGGHPRETRRDLLSIMVKANMAADIPDHQRLSDGEVIAQIPTFFIAGHETTSTATAWASHALSINPAIQTKLREELLGISTNSPTMDELNSDSLPYLDKVVRETMRVYSPVAFTFRMAMDDDILPLAAPFLDTKGRLHDTIPIRKGTIIQIPISGVHYDKEILGDDVGDFKPERWSDIPAAANAIPGIWANLLTFLAGAHNCIGFRFAIVEMKSILFTLVRSFEFETAVGEGGIIPSSTPIQRPKVRSDPKNGGQLPMIVRPYVAS